MKMKRNIVTELTPTDDKGKKKGIRWWNKGGFDMTFFVLVIALLTIGLLMLFSASYAYAYHYSDGASLHYIKSQLIYAVVGIVAMLFCSKLNYQIFEPAAPFLFLITLGLLGLVFVFPPYDGQWYRWIYIGGFSFQPSEIAKFTLVLFLACLMDIFGENLRKRGREFILLIPIAIVCIFVFKQPHLSGMLIIAALGIITISVGGAKMKWLMIIGVVLVAVVAIYVFAFGGIEYAGTRWKAWVDKDFEPTDARWQINQSLYAIGSGGLFGRGIGGSKQKHLYVSEPQNDFIFSIVCEELGFVGAVVIILLFIALVWRGCVIAMRAPDRFGALTAMGIVSQIGIQAALNILVVTDSIPNTGVSLPFFSSGGTSLVMIMAQMGVVLSISRGRSVADLREIIDDKVKESRFKKFLTLWS